MKQAFEDGAIILGGLVIAVLVLKGLSGGTQRRGWSGYVAGAPGVVIAGGGRRARNVGEWRLTTGAHRFPGIEYQ
jgi:hypothetical protein